MRAQVDDVFLSCCFHPTRVKGKNKLSVWRSAAHIIETTFVAAIATTSGAIIHFGLTLHILIKVDLIAFLDGLCVYCIFHTERGVTRDLRPLIRGNQCNALLHCRASRYCSGQLLCKVIPKLYGEIGLCS